MTASTFTRRILLWAIAAVYLAYLIGVAAFTREFAKLGISLAGIPLFVGEGTIAILAVLLVAVTVYDRALPFAFDRIGRALAVYLVIGLGFAVFGLANHYGVAAIRDSALVYYLAFFFFTLAVVHLGVKPGTIVSAIAVGAVIGAIASIGAYVHAPSLTFEHGAPGYQAPMAWFAAVWCCHCLGQAKRAIVRVALAAGAALTLVTIYLTGYRTMFPVMIASLIILWAWAARGKGEDRLAWTRSARATSVAVAFFMIGIAAHNLTMTAPDHPIPGNGRVEFSDGLKLLSYRWVRGFRLLAPTVIQVVQSGQGEAIETSIAFRIDAWKNALAKIEASPLTGIGFGPPPALYPERYCDAPYSPTSNCGNAHNTFLTLALRMGIPTFLFFVVINLVVVAGFLRREFRPSSTLPRPVLAPFLGVTYVSLLLYAFMSLFFESPYLSPLFWVTLGLMHAPTDLRRVTSPGRTE